MARSNATPSVPTWPGVGGAEDVADGLTTSRKQNHHCF